MGERPSKIETLPDFALVDLQWLYDAIQSRRYIQTDMLDIFNRRLAAKGVAGVSKSAISRYALKVRNGGISRPRALAEASHAASAVLAEPFRTALAASVGDVAVRQIEIALTALVRP